MTSAVSICSNALLELGAQPIASLTEANDRARIAANLYESVRDSVLRSHPWNCAVKRVVLAPDTEVPAFDFAAYFLLPGDHLRTLQVGQEDTRPRYRVESGKIAADGTVLYLRYIWRNTSEASWDTMLVDAMTLTMAARMAYGITKSASMAELRETLRRDFMKQCRAVDGQEDPPETLGDERLLNARFGSVRRY